MSRHMGQRAHIGRHGHGTWLKYALWNSARKSRKSRAALPAVPFADPVLRARYVLGAPPASYTSPSHSWTPAQRAENERWKAKWDSTVSRFRAEGGQIGSDWFLNLRVTKAFLRQHKFGVFLAAWMLLAFLGSLHC
jgi:hypothetical protein